MRGFLSDEIVAKYKALPDFLWYIIAVISVFFAHAYEYIVSSAVELSAVNVTLAETNLPLSINPIVFISLTCIFSSLFSELIFEVINHIASNVLLVRFGAKTNRADLKYRLRICFIYSNLLVGLIGIAYFFTQVTEGQYTGDFSPYNIQNDVYYIINALLPFSSLTFFIFIFFEDLRKNYIPKRKHAPALMFIGRIYFGIYLAFALFSVVQNILFVGTTLTVIDIVSVWLDFGITILWSILAYLYYLRIKKENDNQDDDTNQTIITEEKKPHNIYDDFGF